MLNTPDSVLMNSGQNAPMKITMIEADLNEPEF